MRNFDDLSEREMLALAITLEEEDERVYADYAEGLRENFAASAAVFDGMREEESGHRRRLIELYRQQFGEHIPLIRRQDVKGFVQRKSVWLVRPLRLDLVRKQASTMEADPVEIVGIVADMHQALEADPPAAMFRPLDQYPIVSAAFAVRTAGDPLQMVHAVSDQVLAMDRDQPVSAFKTMDELVEAEGGQRRVLLTMLGGFAGAALLLAVIGIYGVVAYSVAQRTQEVGIRRALGARHMDILRLVVGQGLGLTLAGVALGIGGALALTRVMTSLLFHTSSTDPAAFAGIAFLFVIVALAASYIPARRATRIDPMSALR